MYNLVLRNRCDFISTITFLIQAFIGNLIFVTVLMDLSFEGFFSDIASSCIVYGHNLYDFGYVLNNFIIIVEYVDYYFFA